MIVGIGSDLTDIRRIEQTLDRFGDRFVQRIFTDVEQRRSERKAGRASSYAKRFAAKEACAKALGTGLRAGVFWRDMGVVNARSGQRRRRHASRRHHARRLPVRHPSLAHRRLPLCAGVRGHRGPDRRGEPGDAASMTFCSTKRHS